jgi:hypothetical protein
MAPFLVIRLWEHSFYLLGLNINSYISGVEQRNKNLPKFCLSTKHWLHPDTPTCVSFLWTQGMLNIPSLGALWKFRKWTGLIWIVIKLYCTKFPSKVLCPSAPTGLEATYYLHLYLHLQIIIYFLTSQISEIMEFSLIVCVFYGLFSW